MKWYEVATAVGQLATCAILVVLIVGGIIWLVLDHRRH